MEIYEQGKHAYHATMPTDSLRLFRNALLETESIGLDNVKSHTVRGPHPAGNVGIQIHHIAPLGSNDHVWVVNAQDVARIGNYFLTGELDVSLVITIGGPSILSPAHIKSRLGAQVSQYLNNNIKEGEHRIISGDVLTGKKIDVDDFLGFYDSAVAVIAEGGSREFIGMLRPGTASSRYSLTNAFLGTLKGGYDFNTLKNGSERYMVPINSWEEVLPMDIYCQTLFTELYLLKTSKRWSSLEFMSAMRKILLFAVLPVQAK